VKYLAKQNLGLYPGGLPTTFTKTGQQWDFPNCWPPLEHMVVQGLEKTGLAEAKEMAFVLAERRVRVVMGSNKGFKTVLSNNSNNFLC
jgi:alpha,alpha-trehalase